MVHRVVGFATLLVSSVCAFAPSHVRNSRRIVNQELAATPSLKFQFPRVLNPLDFSVDRPQRNRVEGQDLYRQVGVGPEADFEEVKAAVEALKKGKYAKDPKKQIKLDIAQDKIMELRLRQASRGQLKMSGEVLFKNNQYAAAAEAEAIANKKFKAPKWTKGLVDPAPKKYVLECAKWIGGMAFLGGIVLPGFNGPLTLLVICAGMNNLYKRGRPKKFVEEGMPAGQDLPSWPEFSKMAMLTLSCAAVGYTIATSLVMPLVIPALLDGKFAKDRVLIFCFAAMSIFESAIFSIYPKKAAKKKF